MEEGKKNCNSCGWVTNKGICGHGDCTNFGEWKPIVNQETLFKECATCQFRVDMPKHKCNDKCIETNYGNWKAMTELVTNSKGAKQSKNEFLWTDFDAGALLRVAKCSMGGFHKYGAKNWKKISPTDHINHAISHLFLYLTGDRSEDHLAHAVWRLIACMGTTRGGGKK